MLLLYCYLCMPSGTCIQKHRRMLFSPRQSQSQTHTHTRSLPDRQVIILTVHDLAVLNNLGFKLVFWIFLAHLRRNDTTSGKTELTLFGVAWSRTKDELIKFTFINLLLIWTVFQRKTHPTSCIYAPSFTVLEKCRS